MSKQNHSRDRGNSEGPRNTNFGNPHLSGWIQKTSSQDIYPAHSSVQMRQGEFLVIKISCTRIWRYIKVDVAMKLKFFSCYRYKALDWWFHIGFKGKGENSSGDVVTVPEGCDDYKQECARPEPLGCKAAV